MDHDVPCIDDSPIKNSDDTMIFLSPLWDDLKHEKKKQCEMAWFAG